MENIEDKDGFNYSGTYVEIIPYEHIESISDDGRKTLVVFESIDDQVKITETYETDDVTPLAIQQKFTDSVLRNFKRFVEKNNK